MIVYSATRREFSADVFSNQIENRIVDAFETRLGRSVGDSEVRAWKNSLQYMNNILVDGDIAADAGVAIEYRIPQTAKRVDFILTGKDGKDRDTAVIVELKQWTKTATTGRHAMVCTFVGGGRREVLHPSYQAWTYAALIRDFNETVQEDGIQLVPCAYLHNCVTPEALRAEEYRYHIDRAPVFVKSDAEKLKHFLQRYVRKGDSGRLLYRLEHGRIRPSKNLADHLVSLLNGNREFLLIDDQKIVYEQVLDLNRKAQEGRKQVLIVEGGPGTGKSVVAINLLVELTRQRLVAHYVTRNAAPRAVYESKFTQSFRKSFVTNLFKNSGSYIQCEENSLDAVIVDEAHRLNAKSGMYQNSGENQIKELIQAAKLSVFFLDEDQRVTFRDIGESDEIKMWAEAVGATTHMTVLSSQFRCGGSNDYLSWIDGALQIRGETAEIPEGIDYDFRVFDNPNELYRNIVEKNRSGNGARVVAGYCWDWKGKNDPSIRDVTIPEHDFAMRWNLNTDGSLWILKPESINEIGCIHTCQGLELEYVGVIIGPDLVVRDGKVLVDAGKRSKQDSSIRGYKKLLKADPDRARLLADRVVKNTYRTLMTRGQKGCYIYCVDAETNEYFGCLWGPQVREKPKVHAPGILSGLSLRVLSKDEIRPYQNCVPAFESPAKVANDLSRLPRAGSQLWVELPDSFTPQAGQFVVRVVGKSVNRRIPDGSWCLFKVNQSGPWDGKVVLAEHRSMKNPASGTDRVVRIYTRWEGLSEAGSPQVRIMLQPDSTTADYSTLELAPDGGASVVVLGELVAIFG